MSTIGMQSLPEPGHVVRVRMRRWLVEQVEPRGQEDDASLVQLACLDDDAQGDTLSVLWEKELDTQILPRSRRGREAARAAAEDEGRQEEEQEEEEEEDGRRHGHALRHAKADQPVNTPNPSAFES